MNHQFKPIHYFQPEDNVEVLNDIGKDFKDDKVGTVYHRDGDYIYVRLTKSGVEVECYPCELRLIP